MSRVKIPGRGARAPRILKPSPFSSSTEEPKTSDKWHSGVGFPGQILLNNWAFGVNQVFGTVCYQVGSSVRTRNPNDVDVVAMLDDDEFDRWFGPEGDRMGSWRWEWICAAFSELGCKMTGLNIDFKVQKTSVANEKHDGPRSAIGLLDRPRFACVVRTDLQDPTE